MELQLIASGTQNILKWCEGWALTVVAEVWKSWLVIPPHSSMQVANGQPVAVKSRT